MTTIERPRDVRDGDPLRVRGCPKGFVAYRHKEGVYLWSEADNVQAYIGKGGPRAIKAVRVQLSAKLGRPV